MKHEKFTSRFSGEKSTTVGRTSRDTSRRKLLSREKLLKSKTLRQHVVSKQRPTNEFSSKGETKKDICALPTGENSWKHNIMYETDGFVLKIERNRRCKIMRKRRMAWVVNFQYCSRNPRKLCAMLVMRINCWTLDKCWLIGEHLRTLLSTVLEMLCES